MGLNFLQGLPTPEEIKDRFPLSNVLKERKKIFDKEIFDIFTGRSNKFLTIIGPCSADNEEAVLEYSLN